jgi:hypothetical protein|tara:strand:- start:1258 stop:2433 length:1176 start_codon:yes stop_codon:yes gene_type:complete
MADTAELEQYLGMSDEEFAKVNTSELPEADAPDESNPVVESLEVGGDADNVEEALASEDVEGDDLDDEPAETPASESEEPEENEENEEEELDIAAEDENKVDAEKEEPEEQEENKFKDFYRQVTAGFKASGKQMSVHKPEDIVQLMQMGADYNRKMSAMKPNMQLLKMLEKNELLSADKLSYLIDLAQGSPEAIQRLLKDKSIDPLDLDASKGSDYRASDHTVDAREVELDMVVERLQGSETYPKTIRVVTKEWDDASRQVVANEPQLLEYIDGHMASGIYDLISNEIEKERTFGRLNGMSDIDAYRAVGDQINARGGFDHLNPRQDQVAEKPAVQKGQVAKKVSEKQRKDKRRAASPTKPTAPVKSDNRDFNPLSMSDEKFLEQINEKFL